MNVTYKNNNMELAEYNEIEERIITLRDVPVILDSDAAVV